MSGSINEADRTPRHRVRSAFSHALAPLLAAAAAWLTIVFTLDGVGERPALPQGPGLTLDEIFNIETGVYLWRSLLAEGPAIVSPDGARRVFGNPLYNPDHPPLGRLWIGAAHDFALAVAPPEKRAGPYSLTAARTAPATAFALTILLVGVTASRWYGRIAGIAAAASLALMPRLFGHAHLAALETFVGLTFTATVLYTASRWAPANSSTLTPSNPYTRPSLPWRAVSIAGLLFGFTLLTKIQAVLLPIPIGIWALWRFGWRSIPMMLLFGLTGLAVFFALWPWLWLDPIDHFLAYLGRATDRPVLYCYYLGERYADRDVPWHYPFVMFLVTVPAGLHLLGLYGAARLKATQGPAVATAGTDSGLVDNRSMLPLITIAFVLAFFALPGITVYDGARLFLVVFPLWAVMIGKGGQLLWDRLALRWPWPIAALVLTALLGSHSVAMVGLHPAYLSYYNLFTGGLDGADRLGFEPTYWRDSVTRELLEAVVKKVPRGSTLYLAPVLHPANQIDLPLLSPILQQHELGVDSFDDKDPAKRGMRFVLVYRRHADPWDSLEPPPHDARLVAEVRRCGVQLAACYELAGRPHDQE
jgi:hypothetical protein